MERDPMEVALSTDVVMDTVLSYLKVRDLLSCRKVSKFWNKASSSVLRRRSTLIKNISENKDLIRLEKRMKLSSNFPFTGLKFNQPWVLNSGRATKFFENYGARFTRLCLDVGREHRLHDLAPFIGHLTRLSILELGYISSCHPFIKSSNSATGQTDRNILKLPSVRTIRISPFPQIHEDVLREVLAAASPLVQIECLNATPELLSALKNAGKLKAITSIKFDVNECGEYYEWTMGHFSVRETPTLTKLHFSIGGCLSLDGLVQILFTSFHTLKELRLDGMRLSEYSWESFPGLTKLTSLSLYVEIEPQEYFFRWENGYKFPALKELKLKITYDGTDTLRAYLADGVFIVPSLKRIDLDGYVSADGMKQLAQTFPNVVEIGLRYEHYSDDERKESRRNPFEIWSVREFNNLEKLRIWNFSVLRLRPSKNYVSMDSFLTGIPLSIRQNLQKQKPALMLDLIKSPFGESFSQVLREKPNLLQLKNLKELVVCVDRGVGFGQLPKDDPFMSMISMWYALEMMPNLRAKFVCEDRSPYSGLVAAFRHVQECIKLEPFFY